MPTPLPPRSTLFPAGPLSPASAKAQFAGMYDYLDDLLGADGEGATARSGLGLDPIIGTAGALAGRNRIIGDFTLNQRMLTSAADDAYCVDRWYVLTESGNVTVAQIDDPEPGAPKGVRLTQPDASAKRVGLATIIEARNIKQARSASMNFFMRVKPSFAGNVRYAILEHTGTADAVTSDVVSNWASTNFTAGNFFIGGLNVIKTGVVAPGAATYGEISDFGVMGASLNNAILFVWSESAMAQNATLELNRPQFEEGTVATPHEWRLNELELCQRYYEKSYAMGVAPNSTVAVASQICFANLPATVPNSYTYAFVPFRTTKRVAASVVTYAAASGGLNQANNDAGSGYGANTAVPVAPTEMGFSVNNASGAGVPISFATAYVHFVATAEL